MRLPYWNLAMLQKRVNSGCDIRATCPTSGDTVLHMAADKGFANTVSYILQVAPDLADVENKNGHRAVHSCFLGLRPSSKVVRLLLAAMKDPWATDVSGRTILHLAARAGQPDHIHTLLLHVSDTDMEKRDCNGCTPLMIAALYGNARFMCRLLDFGADPCTADMARNTILDLCPHQTSVRIAITWWCDRKRSAMREKLMEVFTILKLLCFASEERQRLEGFQHIMCLHDDILNHLAGMVSNEMQTIDYTQSVRMNKGCGYDRRMNELMLCTKSLFVD